jgi:prevent-host-death family protein
MPAQDDRARDDQAQDHRAMTSAGRMAIYMAISPGDGRMASYSVAEAKDRLPALLAAAERGEAVTITRRGKPIVEFKPVRPAESKRVSRESIDELARALAAFPPQDVDAGTFVRAMRDADDEA